MAEIDLDLYDTPNLTEKCETFRYLIEIQNLSQSQYPVECYDPLAYSLPVTVIVATLLIIMSAGTTLGNFLVILAVGLVKKLQTPSNILIVSLACSDFFVSLLVVPLAIVKTIKGYWPFGEGLCDFWIQFDILLCTSSILNLCAISVDRYLVITRPLQYAVNRTPFRMGLMIAAAWITSTIISLPAILYWKAPFSPGGCDYSDSLDYQIYATFGAFYIPLMVMLVLYGRIFKLARQMAKADAKQKITTLQPEPEPETNCVDGQNSIRFNNLSEAQDGETVALTGEASVPNGSQNKRTANATGGRTKPRSARPVEEHTHKKKQGNNESKAIKTLGVIMGCFTVCWLPFFIIQLTSPLMKLAGLSNIKVVPDWLFLIFLWLGYLNSFLNPIIYAKFNRDFRIPFKLILMCQCGSINARLRSETYAEQYGLPLRSMRKKGRDRATSRRRSSEVYVNMSRKGKIQMGNGMNSAASRCQEETS